MLPAAQRLVADWDHLVADARDFTRFARGWLYKANAAPNAQCALLLPPVIRRFGDSHIRVRVELHDVPEHEVHALVRSGTATWALPPRPTRAATWWPLPLNTRRVHRRMAPSVIQAAARPGRRRSHART